ncbi:hypothetical protein ZIOFF_014079 [Zingiber officinale]|uniref:Protein kinase domain-containing protein n=1 Tax=Zingiber officinale TaxID=94328 RepID=A0A8J5LDE7_ZINOF|nr:hypothetical protein ZIOFF_014079 [Zingiber officinale]
MTDFLLRHHIQQPIYSYEQLCASTNSFDPRRKIGDDGFGFAYLAPLNDSVTALKRLHCHHPAAVTTKSFCNEILILSSLRHPNLVRLHGYCCGLLLVYDYVPNGTMATTFTAPEAPTASLAHCYGLSIKKLILASDLSLLLLSMFISGKIEDHKVFFDFTLHLGGNQLGFPLKIRGLMGEHLDGTCVHGNFGIGASMKTFDTGVKSSGSEKSSKRNIPRRGRTLSLELPTKFEASQNYKKSLVVPEQHGARNHRLLILAIIFLATKSEA